MLSDPVVTPEQMGTYLNDGDSINVPRALMMIELAQEECETVVAPVPLSAANIVLRVAIRGYSTTTSARQYQLSSADAQAFGAAPGPVGGIYLTPKDEADLLRHVPSPVSGTSAFTIRTRPSLSPFGPGPGCGGFGGYW